jgi:hypothetical protein
MDGGADTKTILVGIKTTQIEIKELLFFDALYLQK